MAKTINPKDPGSLNVGNNPDNIAIGDLVLIEGETRPRRCTYVMGTKEKSNVHLVFKGFGPVPLTTGNEGKDGRPLSLEYKKVSAVVEVPAPKTAEEIKAEIEKLQAALKDAQAPVPTEAPEEHEEEAHAAEETGS